MSDTMNYRAMLQTVFHMNGLDDYINEETVRKFEMLNEILLKTNEVMNLTAIKTPEAVAALHFADCAKIASLFSLNENATVIDIGCGGGFPTLPLAILRPDMQILGVDSTKKKVDFVESVAKYLSLQNVKAISARAEELAHDQTMRESFDYATSRAVARMNILQELCMPFVKVGGSFVAMKGAAGKEEAAEAEKGIHTMGGRISAVNEYQLRLLDGEEKRIIIEVQKNKATPVEYPRMFSSIKKKPL